MNIAKAETINELYIRIRSLVIDPHTAVITANAYSAVLIHAPDSHFFSRFKPTESHEAWKSQAV